MRATLAVAAAVSLAVGCGSAASAPGSTQADETSLKISYWSEGNDATKTSDKPAQWTLRCDPPGGTHPRAAEACRKLKAQSQPFRPLRKDLQCTQQYGGPDEALISGTYLGRPVYASLSLRDGCRIARFKRLQFLVPGLRVSSFGS